jgi:predicted nuclease of predicted toxin-antitoxin system
VKFKLDENLPVELVTDLRRLGHDADTVAGEGLRGAADPAVVDAALAANAESIGPAGSNAGAGRCWNGKPPRLRRFALFQR